MAAVLLILGLLAAGIYTGAVGFYIAAGVLVGLWLLMVIFTVGVAAKIGKSVKKDFDSFDSDVFSKWRR